MQPFDWSKVKHEPLDSISQEEVNQEGFPGTIDRKPETEDERGAILQCIMDQAQEVAEVEAFVTCPCGHRAKLVFAFQCYHCGIWFCRRCAARHFGEPK